MYGAGVAKWYVGLVLGAGVGEIVGMGEGAAVGGIEGTFVGARLGAFVGLSVGINVGVSVGASVGFKVLGDLVGAVVGITVGQCPLGHWQCGVEQDVHFILTSGCNCSVEIRYVFVDSVQILSGTFSGLLAWQSDLNDV